MERELEMLLEEELVVEGEQNALALSSSSAIKVGCGICCC